MSMGMFSDMGDEALFPQVDLEAAALEEGLGILARNDRIFAWRCADVVFPLLDFLLVKNEKTLGSMCFRGFMNLAVLLEVTS